MARFATAAQHAHRHDGAKALAKCLNGSILGNVRLQQEHLPRSQRASGYPSPTQFGCHRPPAKRLSLQPKCMCRGRAPLLWLPQRNSLKPLSLLAILKRRLSIAKIDATFIGLRCGSHKSEVAIRTMHFGCRDKRFAGGHSQPAVDDRPSMTARGTPVTAAKVHVLWKASL